MSFSHQPRNDIWRLLRQQYFYWRETAVYYWYYHIFVLWELSFNTHTLILQTRWEKGCQCCHWQPSLMCQLDVPTSGLREFLRWLWLVFKIHAYLLSQSITWKGITHNSCNCVSFLLNCIIKRFAQCFASFIWSFRYDKAAVTVPFLLMVQSQPFSGTVHWGSKCQCN